jgi:hypothetical protein
LDGKLNSGYATISTSAEFIESLFHHASITLYDITKKTKSIGEASAFLE